MSKACGKRACGVFEIHLAERINPGKSTDEIRLRTSNLLASPRGSLWRNSPPHAPFQDLRATNNDALWSRPKRTQSRRRSLVNGWSRYEIRPTKGIGLEETCLTRILQRRAQGCTRVRILWPYLWSNHLLRGSCNVGDTGGFVLLGEVVCMSECLAMTE